MKEHRLVGFFCVAIAALCLAGVAQAQTRTTPCSATTPNNALCISWNAITTDTSGAQIAGVSYRVQQKAGSAAFANVQASGSSTQYYATNLSPGTYLFRVYANCATCTSESAASNEASAAATSIPVVPSTPVIIIAATIRADGPPTYRIIQSVTLKPNEVVFTAPASMRPLFANR